MEGVTRRRFALSTMLTASLLGAEQPLAIPVRLIRNSRSNYSPGQMHTLFSPIWLEAVGEFQRCGIEFQTVDVGGEVRRTPADRPFFTNLDRHSLNVVITDHIPMSWDRGRALAGITAIHEGYHVILIALEDAHRNQIPFVSLNTCVHELLHAFLLDIFLPQPPWYETRAREYRVDAYATALWLLHSGTEIRKSARIYLDRLLHANA